MDTRQKELEEFAKFRKAHLDLTHKDKGERVREYAEGLFDRTFSPESHSFKLWLAAKEQAREENKPRTTVFLRQTHVGTAWTYAEAHCGAMFKTKADAVHNAEQFGFIVENIAPSPTIEPSASLCTVCNDRKRVLGATRSYYIDCPNCCGEEG